ncbi:BREX-1 system adenine-specific DNA-methyltransferase PglX [Paenibacillus urinalis]|uniref:site-specific DNA-methyltransferase (adenine-specific) n=2 Tax=Paenibacillus TaxID=44249 RepID=A0AAX3N408_9BACL|nr:BREX-1 system adenine-specific DNA-methyltransferase PglX [Paenibacillus urinalis]WDH83362.1 BREX-1 system adenine-specific DNA-methyltransferase PglX [Paenibacillus urinalis]
MNKTALKNFATNARKELIEKVKAKAFKIGITEENIKKAQIESSDGIYIDGKRLTATEKKQREKLIFRIREIGYQQVVEEVAYTWFNRFTALRFMEVNNYLPTKVRVLSSSNPDSSEPDIIKEALTVDLEIDKELVYDLKVDNKTEELFKYLVIKQCNSLNKDLPFMFETIDDYKEVLFPEGLLAKSSFLREMTDLTNIPASDWEQVEIIGWLYQYYIAEKKEQVFADLKKNIKISKENIPAATQIFTTNWIVRYMVENSLGRIWIESYPDSSLKSGWEYYLDDAIQEEEVKKQFEEIRYRNVSPEEITFLDPSCGSGHILVYAFDVLFTMYLEKGYSENEIPKLILEKNLYGLDIDDRAIQLASFAIMMKAREKSRRVFGQDIQLNICAIQESNWMTDEILKVLVDDKAPIVEQNTQKEKLQYIRTKFKDAKEYGSILNVEYLDTDFLEKRLIELNNGQEEQADIIEFLSIAEIIERLPSIIKQQKVMSSKYAVVCTNPPYMGSNGAGEKLSNFLKKSYPNTKSDLFSCFIEKGFDYLSTSGLLSMITMESWMTLSSYEKLREYIVNSKTLINMVHMPYLGKGGTSLGINFGTSAFIIRNTFIDNYSGQYTYIRYYETNEEGVPLQFPTINERYKTAKSKDFCRIPGIPIAYWIDDSVYDIYRESNRFSDFAYSFQGMITGDNNYYLRLWYEINNNNLLIGCSNIQEMNEKSPIWIPYKKGGKYCKWYGNNDYVLRWIDNGRGLTRARTENKAYYL